MSRGGLYHFPVVFYPLPPCCFLLLTIQGNLVQSKLSQRFPFLLLAPLHWQLHVFWGFMLVSNLHNLNPMANLIRGKKQTSSILHICYFFPITIRFHIRKVLHCFSQIHLQALVIRNLSLLFVVLIEYSYITFMFWKW